MYTCAHGFPLSSYKVQLYKEYQYYNKKNSRKVAIGLSYISPTHTVLYVSCILRLPALMTRPTLWCIGPLGGRRSGVGADEVGSLLDGVAMVEHACDEVPGHPLYGKERTRTLVHFTFLSNVSTNFKVIGPKSPC